MLDSFGWLLRVAEIGKIEATILSTNEGRIAVCFRGHLGSVEKGRAINQVVCNYHDTGERADRTTSRSYADNPATGVV